MCFLCHKMRFGENVQVTVQRARINKEQQTKIEFHIP